MAEEKTSSLSGTAAIITAIAALLTAVAGLYQAGIFRPRQASVVSATTPLQAEVTNAAHISPPPTDTATATSVPQIPPILKQAEDRSRGALASIVKGDANGLMYDFRTPFLLGDEVIDDTRVLTERFSAIAARAQTWPGVTIKGAHAVTGAEAASELAANPHYGKKVNLSDSDIFVTVATSGKSSFFLYHVIEGHLEMFGIF